MRVYRMKQHDLHDSNLIARVHENLSLHYGKSFSSIFVDKRVKNCEGGGIF